MEPNMNGRIYDENVMKKALDKYKNTQNKHKRSLFYKFPRWRNIKDAFKQLWVMYLGAMVFFTVLKISVSAFEERNLIESMLSVFLFVIILNSIHFVVESFMNRKNEIENERLFGEVMQPVIDPIQKEIVE